VVSIRLSQGTLKALDHRRNVRRDFMNIVVSIKHIPSIADDLPVKENNIDFDSVDFVLNEFDEQSIEQALVRLWVGR
jgi:hypothetical protein